MRLGRSCYIVLLAVTSAALSSVFVSSEAQNQGADASQFVPATPFHWAYPVGAPAARAEDDGTLKRLPGSNAAFTITQVRDAFNVADWHPGGHPSMPGIVKHGRRPDVRGCGYCHLPNGQGRPENSSLAGLPAAYIVQQMADFKNGLRKSSEPRMGPPNSMIAIAKAATDDEVKAAAEYFSSFRLKPWIRVVESNTVPKTRVAGGMLVAEEHGGTEPVGQRIIEMPENLEHTELRDPRSGFLAYVPVGSIKKGQELVTTGGTKVVRRADCRGQDRSVCHLPRSRPERSRAGARHRGPLAQLPRAPALRHEERRAPRLGRGTHESGRRQPERRRPGPHRRLHRLPHPL